MGDIYMGSANDRSKNWFFTISQLGVPRIFSIVDHNLASSQDLTRTKMEEFATGAANDFFKFEGSEKIGVWEELELNNGGPPFFFIFLEENCISSGHRTLSCAAPKRSSRASKGKRPFLTLSFWAQSSRLLDMFHPSEPRVFN